GSATRASDWVPTPTQPTASGNSPTPRPSSTMTVTRLIMNLRTSRRPHGHGRSDAHVGGGAAGYRNWSATDCGCGDLLGRLDRLIDLVEQDLIGDHLIKGIRGWFAEVGLLQIQEAHAPFPDHQPLHGTLEIGIPTRVQNGGMVVTRCWKLQPLQGDFRLEFDEPRGVKLDSVDIVTQMGLPFLTAEGIAVGKFIDLDVRGHIIALAPLLSEEPGTRREPVCLPDCR